MEQAHARKQAEAREAQRETGKVTQRMGDRLGVAEARYQAVQAALNQDKQKQSTALWQDVKRTEHELVRHESDVLDQLSGIKVQRLEREAQAEQSAASRESALRDVESTREQRDLHSDRIDAEICRASEEAGATIASGRSQVRAKLDDLRQQRDELEAQSQRAMASREAQTKATIEDLRKQSHTEVTSSEAYRHRAAMSVDRFGELLQAAKSTAGAKMKLTESYADQKSGELTRARHQVQQNADAALGSILKSSADEISAAHRHCSQVSAAHADEAAVCARKAEQMQREAEAHARDAERQVSAIEGQRKRDFAGGRDAVQETENKLQGGRDACDRELDGINQRLHEIEEETRAKAANILCQWADGTAATELAIRACEQRSRQALEQLRQTVESLRKEAHGRNEAIQRQSASTVSSLEQRANETVDATQGALEAARRNDEEATAAALLRLRELRPVPEQAEAAADARIADLAAQVQKEEERLRQDAEERMAQARTVTSAARAEEKQLQAETAEAWQRLRKACYQLRLMNLHDLAEGIVEGGFDKPVAVC